MACETIIKKKKVLGHVVVRPSLIQLGRKCVLLNKPKNDQYRKTAELSESNFYSLLVIRNSLSIYHFNTIAQTHYKRLLHENMCGKCSISISIKKLCNLNVTVLSMFLLTLLLLLTVQLKLIVFLSLIPCTQDWDIITTNLADKCTMQIIFLMSWSVSRMPNQTCYQLCTL